MNDYPFWLLILLSCVTTFSSANTDTFPRQHYGKGIDNIAFVENQSCADCHPKQFSDWLGSHHELAMNPATQQYILGDFNNTEFKDDTISAQFYTQDQQYFVKTTGKDGTIAEFTIKYTFGVTPLQQYLLQFPNGRLQTFTVAWDSIKKQWFNLYPDRTLSADNPLHWTQTYHTWNAVCAECHSTDLNVNYDLKTDSYQTTWAEINVSCQACHGAGEQHLAWANSDKKDPAMNPSKGLSVDYKQLDSKQKVETCARCHSRRYPVSEQDLHAQPMLNDFVPELLRDNLYHPDGQILDEVYVYGSFVQSKMYHNGVQCMDCHDPHTLKLRREGNATCTYCHQSEPPTSLYPSLNAKNYDTPEHHFHAQNTEASQCVNCHAPTQNFMVIDPRRDHSFRIPRPDLSLKLNTPNACNQCHTDKDAVWATDAMNQWYGDKSWQKPHFGEILALGRMGDANVSQDLIKLALDTKQADIVRATALELLQAYGQIGVDTTHILLTDKSALVRSIAVHSLQNASIAQKIKSVVPLLKDEVHAVRIEAARSLVNVPREQLPDVKAYDKALAEYKQAQIIRGELPEGHFNLGQLYADIDDIKQAEHAFKTAIEKGQYFFPASRSLAILYHGLGDKKQAEQVLRDAIKVSPEQGLLYYSLGLLLAELKRMPEALDSLKKATELMPYHPKVHYNYAMLLKQVGRGSQVEPALLKAFYLDRQNAQVTQTLAELYIRQQRWLDAYDFTKHLNQLVVPNNAKIKSTLKKLERRKAVIDIQQKMQQQ
ncbi:tetratricopeptide repeat protein [Candidatus Albibeggiatoa sp. nov. BB20]|uniref:multiheme c-type cytochrome n=1 Tax=Candidatus Albibeggiatoa sp. nov. BB20 TaxID=3162723 RepID=UPI00336545A5